MRAALYIRMSTDEQASSPERQRSTLLPYCERRGFVVHQIYEDLGMRGSNDERPSFKRLLADAVARRFDVIVVDEPSRLTRMDAVDFFYKVVGPLRDAGVSLETVANGPVDWNELPGLLMMTIRQHSASSEPIMLGWRVATGMAKRARQAKLFVGRPPLGYQYKKVDGRRVGLEAANPEEQRVVRHIFDAYVNRDLSLEGIAAELNRSGEPTDRPWRKKRVHEILRNPTYAGFYVWGRTQQGKHYRCCNGQLTVTKRGSPKSHKLPQDQWLRLPGDHVPLIEIELFERAQALLSSNRIRTGPARIKQTYPFSGLLRCDHCGRTMFGTRVKGDPFYRCGTADGGNGCGSWQVRESVLVRQVLKTLEQTFLHPANLERLREEIRRQQEAEADRDTGEAERLQKVVTRLGGDIAKAKRNLLLLDEQDIPAAKVTIKEWERELAEARMRLDQQVNSTPVACFDNLVNAIERLVECVSSADPGLVRTLLRETIGGVDLRHRALKKRVYTRYPLAGGVIHLLGEAEECVGSSPSVPAAGR